MLNDRCPFRWLVFADPKPAFTADGEKNVRGTLGVVVNGLMGDFVLGIRGRVVAGVRVPVPQRLLEIKTPVR